MNQLILAWAGVRFWIRLCLSAGWHDVVLVTEWSDFLPGTAITSGESVRREEIYPQPVMEAAPLPRSYWRMRPAGRDLGLA
jgi:hypothetical protein